MSSRQGTSVNVLIPGNMDIFHGILKFTVQDALSTAVAFPYGQLGAVLPIAVALALFANINMSFAPVSPSDPKGAPSSLQGLSPMAP